MLKFHEQGFIWDKSWKQEVITLQNTRYVPPVKAYFCLFQIQNTVYFLTFRSGIRKVKFCTSYEETAWYNDE